MITVIVPIYNSERYLGKCVQSIIAQSYAEWQLILVDDGSKDNSWQMIQSYASRDARIVPLHQENAGPGAARNYGMQYAEGDYVVFVDSDDTIEPQYFELLSKHDEDLVFINVQDKDADGCVIRKEYMSRYKKLSKDDILRGQMTGKIPWGGVRKCLKKCLLMNNNILYTKHKIGEEALYSYQVLRYAKTVGFIEEPLYNYLQREDSQSHLPMDDPWGEVAIEMRKMIFEIGDYEAYGDTVNAFILAAAACSAKNMAQNYGFKEYLSKVKDRRRLLLETLDLKREVDYHSMDKRMLLVGLLLKYRFHGIIWLASRVKGSVGW